MNYFLIKWLQNEKPFSKFTCDFFLTGSVLAIAKLEQEGFFEINKDGIKIDFFVMKNWLGYNHDNHSYQCIVSQYIGSDV